MAYSGSTNVKVTAWNTLKFNWKIQSQSVAGNYTDVGWSLSLVSTSDGFIDSSAPKSWEVRVEGHTYTGENTVGINNNSTKTLASGVTRVNHNTDGTKTFNYSFKQQFDINFNGWIGDVSGQGSGTLERIGRASQPSCITWPEHTQNVGSFGDTISIHMNRASSDFTHTVRFQFGSASGTIATDVTTGTTWTIPKELMVLIPNSLSGSGTIYVDTYFKGTSIGTKWCGFTATVPTSSDCYPTAKLTLEDTTGWDDVYGSPVQGLSVIKITVTPGLAYGSPIVAYTLSADGDRHNASTATVGALRASGDVPVTATVKDQRGRSGSVSYTMKVQAYTPPNVSKLTVHRCDADGTENEQGEYIRVVFSAAVTALGNKNVATYKLRYKKATDAAFTEKTLSDIANVYTVSEKVHIFEADGNSSYEVEIEAADRHRSSTRSTSASTAFTLINWGADGTSMGIGKMAEEANTMQIALDVEFLGKVKGSIFDAIYPVGSIYMAFSPSAAYTPRISEAKQTFVPIER